MKTEDIKTIIDALKLVNVQPDLNIEIKTDGGTFELTCRKFPKRAPYVECLVYVRGGYIDTVYTQIEIETHNNGLFIKSNPRGLGMGLDSIKSVTIGRFQRDDGRVTVYKRK